MPDPSRLALVRHGRTAWSAAGRHTGRTDIPLDDEGREQARAAGPAVAAIGIDRIRVSPLVRARETCALLGLGIDPIVEDDLVEWDYGDYEGITTAEIRASASGWTVFGAPCPGGETADDVAERVDRVIDRAVRDGGTTLLVAHGHVLRVLAARWLGLPPEDGRLLRLDTATVSLLGWERETRVVLRWNVGA